MQSLTAQTGGAPIADVTLSGTVRFTNGSNAGSGAITLSATADGQSRVTMSLPSGQQTEVRNHSPMSHTGSWTGPDGASHDFSLLNLLGPHPAWFFPAFVMKNGFMSTQFFAGDLGPATWEGASVEHLAIFRRPHPERFAPPTVNPFLKQITQHDIYLDPSTLLPVAMTFNVHLDPNSPGHFLVPEGAPSGDILEEVRFSDYRQVQGRPVAFHIQVYFNGALACDIQLTSASIGVADAGTAASN